MATGTYSGNLNEVPPHRLISDILRGGFIGKLSLERESHNKTLYFNRGALFFAQSSVMEDRLGQVLLRSGRIDQEALDSALAEHEAGDRKRPLGAILVQMDAISARDLVWGVNHMVERIFCDCYGWDDGRFTFEEADDPSVWDVINLELSSAELLQAALDRVIEPGHLARLLGDFTARAETLDGWEKRAEEHGLGEADRQLADLASPGTHTLASLLLATPYPAGITARSLLFLHGMGIVTLRGLADEG